MSQITVSYTLLQLLQLLQMKQLNTALGLQFLVITTVSCALVDFVLFEGMFSCRKRGLSTSTVCNLQA